LRKWFKSLEKALCEHSWNCKEFLESPAMRFTSQPSALEPRREVGRPEGLCEVKGDPIPWVVQVERKERVGGSTIQDKFSILFT
jgi:hypothetical protein